MKSKAQVARLVRDRSPLSAEETTRILRDFFVPSRALRFVCDVRGAAHRAVLDVGCGYGQHLVHFGDGSAGIDAVNGNVAFCRALGVGAVLANVENGLPDFGRRFDAVYCSNLLEHLVAPHLFLLRLHRQLTERGELYMHIPTMPPHPIADWVIRRTIGHNGYRASEHINAFTPRTLAFTLERAGFEVIDLVFVSVRGRPFGRLTEPLFRELGISVLAVARRDPEFSYPEKRVAAFEPDFARS